MVLSAIDRMKLDLLHHTHALSVDLSTWRGHVLAHVYQAVIGMEASHSVIVVR